MVPLGGQRCSLLSDSFDQNMSAGMFPYTIIGRPLVTLSLSFPNHIINSVGIQGAVRMRDLVPIKQIDNSEDVSVSYYRIGNHNQISCLRSQVWKFPVKIYQSKFNQEEYQLEDEQQGCMTHGSSPSQCRGRLCWQF